MPVYGVSYILHTSLLALLPLFRLLHFAPHIDSQVRDILWLKADSLRLLWPPSQLNCLRQQVANTLNLLDCKWP